MKCVFSKSTPYRSGQYMCRVFRSGTSTVFCGNRLMIDSLHLKLAIHSPAIEKIWTMQSNNMDSDHSSAESIAGDESFDSGKRNQSDADLSWAAIPTDTETSTQTAIESSKEEIPSQVSSFETNFYNFSATENVRVEKQKLAGIMDCAGDIIMVTQEIEIVDPETPGSSCEGKVGGSRISEVLNQTIPTAVITNDLLTGNNNRNTNSIKCNNEIDIISKPEVSSTTTGTQKTAKENKRSANTNNLTEQQRLLLRYCSICSKGFRDQYSVNMHKRIHTGEKPFTCPLCGKSFRQKAHLTKHSRSHTPEQE